MLDTAQHSLLQLTTVFGTPKIDKALIISSLTNPLIILRLCAKHSFNIFENDANSISLSFVQVMIKVGLTLVVGVKAFPGISKQHFTFPNVWAKTLIRP